MKLFQQHKIRMGCLWSQLQVHLKFFNVIQMKI